MKPRFRFTLAFCTAAVAVAGCGAPIMPVASSAAPAFSSLTASKSTAFLYVAGARGRTFVKIFTYPKIKLVGQVISDENYAKVCSDPKTGHVFVSQTNGLDEYQRGTTKKIATLAAPDGYTELAGCSIDPLSGNVAVVTEGGPAVVLVFSHGTGTPTVYTDPTIASYYYCAYDDSGNLFVLGYGVGKTHVRAGFAELLKGGNVLFDIRLNQSISEPQKLQWDGKFMALELGGTIHRVQVFGTEGKIVSTTILQSGNPAAGGDLWINGNTILGPHGGLTGKGSSVGVWKYPAGGDPIRVTRDVTYKRTDIGDLNLSVMATK
jgi:hypothetical protein